MENVYNTVVVIEYFITNQPEINECCNLAPIIKNLMKIFKNLELVEHLDSGINRILSIYDKSILKSVIIIYELSFHSISK